jgi:hypothetical protein
MVTYSILFYQDEHQKQAQAMTYYEWREGHSWLPSDFYQKLIVPMSW